ncbi:MAG: OsmC family peroxiredoxin [Bacteroidetes bacterium]|nr:OsmC family peroxiredoxin [Bacteroidota bacterium]
MFTSRIEYKGNLRTEATHLQSGNSIVTDAPTDNHGQGAYFSPTDLVATALATCIITTIGIKVANENIRLDGWKADVQKHMVNNPRRIGAIDIHMYFSPDIQYSEAEKEKIKEIADTCPVALSLHPDIKQNLIYHFTD